jgi:LysM repeat protein
MKRTRILIVALMVAVLLMLCIGPMTASAAGPGCAAYHYVYPGQTLYGIAWRYGTTVQAIAVANGIWNVNYIRAGQTLCIPWGPGPGPVPGVHVVRWGETLLSISRMYGRSVWAIASANGIWNMNYIRAGQRLVIP